MLILRPKDTRIIGFFVSVSIFIIAGGISISNEKDNPIAAILFMLTGLAVSLYTYFNNLITVPIGKNAVKYFWNEPQRSSVLSEGTHWIMPFFEKVTWDDITTQSQLFTLSNIRAFNNEPLSFNVVVQYSIFDVLVTLYKKPYDRVIKMQQIMTDTLNIEIQQNRITDTGIMVSMAMLTAKIKVNLASHMEIQWGTRVESISIMSVTHLNQSRQNDLTDNNSLGLQINRVLQIARDLHCTPEDAYKHDLIRTGRVTQSQRLNIYSFPEAVSIIQAVGSILNRS